MKKKILLLITFIIVAIVVLYNGESKEVKAEENCETYTNYYLFLDATPKEWYNSRTYPLERTTAKGFPLGISNNIKADDIIGQGKVELTTSKNAKNDETGMTLEYFYERYISIEPEGVEEIGTNSYVSAIEWFDENGEQQTGSRTMYDNYDDFLASVPTNLANPEFSQIAWAPEETFITITRNWSSSSVIPNIGVDEDVMSPAVYYIKYQVCEEVEPETYSIDVEYLDKETGKRIQEDTNPVVTDVEAGTEYEYDCSEQKFNGYAPYTEDQTNYPTIHKGEVVKDETLKCYYVPADTYDLTVEHYDNETNKKIEEKEDFFKEGFLSGDKFEYECPKIDGYTVIDTKDKPGKHVVEFEDEDITRQCYYTRNTYVLTVKYGSDEDCKDLLAESVSKDVKYKEVGEVDVPSSIGDMTNPKLGNVSPDFVEPTLGDKTVKVTMPAKNVEVCIVYTPKTGLSWLYLAWVIGGLSLGYSIWYFVRYYKKQNSEI